MHVKNVREILGTNQDSVERVSQSYVMPTKPGAKPAGRLAPADWDIGLVHTRNWRKSENLPQKV